MRQMSGIGFRGHYPRSSALRRVNRSSAAVSAARRPLLADLRQESARLGSPALVLDVAEQVVPGRRDARGPRWPAGAMLGHAEGRSVGRARRRRPPPPGRRAGPPSGHRSGRGRRSLGALALRPLDREASIPAELRAIDARQDGQDRRALAAGVGVEPGLPVADEVDVVGRGRPSRRRRPGAAGRIRRPPRPHVGGWSARGPSRRRPWRRSRRPPRSGASGAARRAARRAPRPPSRDRTAPRSPVRASSIARDQPRLARVPRPGDRDRQRPQRRCPSARASPCLASAADTGRRRSPAGRCTARSGASPAG